SALLLNKAAHGLGARYGHRSVGRQVGQRLGQLVVLAEAPAFAQRGVPIIEAALRRNERGPAKRGGAAIDQRIGAVVLVVEAEGRHEVHVFVADFGVEKQAVGREIAALAGLADGEWDDEVLAGGRQTQQVVEVGEKSDFGQARALNGVLQPDAGV
nr:hypothetical protein [Tanacetum cinerariifolium]